jgi:hypothetical protein
VARPNTEGHEERMGVLKRPDVSLLSKGLTATHETEWRLFIFRWARLVPKRLIGQHSTSNGRGSVYT